MRKLKLQVQMTLDGYVAGPNGEMDMMEMNWDDQLKDYTQELTNSFDTIVMGRNLAEGFIPFWEGVAKDDSNPEQAAGKVFADTPKVVFSNTLNSSPWENAVVTNGNIIEEINQLKQQEGKGLIAYGGATFVSSLIENGLIDEYHIYLNPNAIGTGMPIFNKLNEKQQLKLKHAKPFDCGITVLCYEPK